MAWTVLNRWPTGGAHFTVGYEFERLGRHAEAIAQYRQSVDTFPRAGFYLARELVNTGHIDDAVQQFRAFITRAPALVEVLDAHLAIGQLLTGEGDWQNGVTEFRQVLAMTPGNLNAMKLLAGALAHERAFDEACSWYRAYLARRPTDVAILNDFGVTLSQSEQHDGEAVTVLQRAVALDPRNATVLLNLARAEFLVDDVANATQAARQGIALDPANAAAHDLLARGLGLQGEIDAARQELVEALRLDPTDMEAREILNRLSAVMRVPVRNGR
jgi:tetratricopeptide (TPR) repeat protein